MTYIQPNPNGSATSANSSPVVIASDQSTVPVSLASVPSHAVTNAGTFAVQSTNQANSGVDIGDVTINNAAGVSAVNIQDGGNSITVDGTVAVSGTVTVASHAVTNAGTFVTQENGASLTAIQLLDDVVTAQATAIGTTKTSLVGVSTTTAAPTYTTGTINPLNSNTSGALRVDGSGVTQPVSIASVPSHAVTNAGTFAVQNTAATPAGTNNIGDVDVLTINGVAPAFGTGVRGATVQRVTIATDDVVPASQSGTWNITNVSGTVSLPTGAATSANQTTEITALQLIDDAIVADNAAFTDGTTKLDMAGYIYDEVAGTALTENDAAAARINVNRAQVQTIEDGVTRGRYATVSAANALKVDNSGVTQPVSGTVSITANSAVNVAQINGVATSMGNGVSGTGVQRVTMASDSTGILAGVTTVTTLTNQSQMGGQAIAMGTGVRSAGTQRVTVATDDLVPVSMATNTPLGTVAHDSADSGAPIKTGGRAVSAEITPVTTGDRTDSIHDLAGKQVVMPYANNENFVSGAITTAMTGTTSTSLVAAPAAGLRNYITTIIVSNSHATVGTDVIIQDGSGGTTLMTIPAAAVYGGAVINLPVPLRQPTTATAIYCANVTTGASTKVSAVGYKGY
jgi:hypothetical protein